MLAVSMYPIPPDSDEAISTMSAGISCRSSTFKILPEHAAREAKDGFVGPLVEQKSEDAPTLRPTRQITTTEEAHRVAL